MLRPLRTAYGVARSLLIYYGRPWQFAGMDAFYARFVRPGDLCFDLGAHVGNRVRSWRRLGARVIAVEPQPALARTLRLLYGRDPQVRIIQAAIAADEGPLTLHLNLTNPTISTTSAQFLAQAQTAASFRGQRWVATTTVPATSIDALIARHGEPRFVKLDVEGFEAEALAGLTRPLFALSVEFVPMAKGVAEAAVRRLATLGEYHFNASLGDRMRLLHAAPLDAGAVLAWLQTLPEDGPAGDLYACREQGLLA